MKNNIVITFEPDSSLLKGKLEEKLFIYYCNDDHQEKGFWWNRKNSIIKRERDLLLKSDIVFSLTEGFASYRKRFNKNIYIVPNAIDDKFVSLSSAQSSSLPQDMKNIIKPLIGYFGMVDSRLDIDLLINIAKRRPDWSFVLIGMITGKVNNSFTELRSLRNVYYLGEKAYAEIPSYINSMDVCLIPIIMSERTKNVLSIKLFEYTALGKPIVATNLPELHNYDKFVKISSTENEFITNIGQCLKEFRKKESQEAIAFANNNTWRHRAIEISRIIQHHLG